MWYNFENYYVLIIIALFFIIMNIIGYIRNKAWYPMATLLIFVASLIVHIMRREVLAETFTFNTTIDFIGLGISITNLLIIDEIEMRREVIKEVFENRYKK